MSKQSDAQQKMDDIATTILNKSTLSSLDREILDEYKRWNPSQAEWIDEALFLFDTKEPPA
tara:strand:+ start:243 stop:425 length:183 start_codon:yes stop_codon:yes gene_type:complete